jgi:hypothetical protein
MGWRFRKSVSIAPGIRVNMGRGGITSLSVGGRGGTLNIGKRGVTSTSSIPGTGLSYQHRWRRRAASSSSGSKSGGPILGLLLLIGIGYAILRTPSQPNTPNVATLPAHISQAVTGGPTAGLTLVESAIAAPISQVATARPHAADISESAGPLTRQMTVVQAANVRSEPTISGAVLRTISKGAVVQVVNAQRGWWQIVTPDGQPIGWVHSSLLR